MNAKEIAKKIESQEIVLSGYIRNGTEETILRALRLLAAAEANDGTTPETDVEIFDANQGAAHTLNLPVVDAAFARQLERERNGLAAKMDERK